MSSPYESLSSSTPPAPPEIPEHMVVLLLEAGQRFLAKAEEAIQRRDPLIREHFLKKTLSVLEELNRRLNCEHGGDLVGNLSRIYGWWGQEIFDAGMQEDAHRLHLVSIQMGEIRRAWEQVLFKGEGLSESPGI